jgi:hypothetical protein
VRFLVGKSEPNRTLGTLTAAAGAGPPVLSSLSGEKARHVHEPVNDGPDLGGAHSMRACDLAR